MDARPPPCTFRLATRFWHLVLICYPNGGGWELAKPSDKPRAMRKRCKQHHNRKVWRTGAGERGYCYCGWQNWTILICTHGHIWRAKQVCRIFLTDLEGISPCPDKHGYVIVRRASAQPHQITRQATSCVTGAEPRALQRTHFGYMIVSCTECVGTLSADNIASSGTVCMDRWSCAHDIQSTWHRGRSSTELSLRTTSAISSIVDSA
eukprot:5014677-Amphidinium_carterae.2